MATLLLRDTTDPYDRAFTPTRSFVAYTHINRRTRSEIMSFLFDNVEVDVLFRKIFKTWRNIEVETNRYGISRRTSLLGKPERALVRYLRLRFSDGIQLSECSTPPYRVLVFRNQGCVATLNKIAKSFPAVRTLRFDRIRVGDRAPLHLPQGTFLREFLPFEMWKPLLSFKALEKVVLKIRMPPDKVLGVTIRFLTFGKEEGSFRLKVVDERKRHPRA